MEQSETQLTQVKIPCILTVKLANLSNALEDGCPIFIVSKVVLNTSHETKVIGLNHKSSCRKFSNLLYA